MFITSDSYYTLILPKRVDKFLENLYIVCEVSEATRPLKFRHITLPKIIIQIEVFRIGDTSNCKLTSN